jgi:hypothetical protein
MKYLVYNIEENGREHFVFSSATRECAKDTIMHSKDVFKRGYRIYEQRLVETGIPI